jgi:general secretion pathway protein J
MSAREPLRSVKRGEAGFSLIEMLVAITILALVLAMLPGTFSLAHRTWDATAVLDQRARQDGGRMFLQARLAEAMPVFEPVGAGAVQLVFTGSAETLTFVAPSANGPQGAGLYRFILESQPQGSAGNALTVTVAPFVLKRGRDNDAMPAEQHVLYQGITSASFRYFGRKDLRTATPSWQTAWTRRDVLPDAVELAITTGKTTRTILIELRLKNGP